jgi:tungstate transport system substrate-binding protein
MSTGRTGRFLLAATLLGFLLCITQVGTVAEKELLMATTTSTDNTGLLDYLAPQFTKDTGIDLIWVATGTGKALKLGESCDADVLLVHAPEAEKHYVADGFGINRREIMYNDFVIIGPPDDPASIGGKNVVDALDRIREKGAIFASRGDNSGTNKKELSLWESAGGTMPEKETWYVQTGQGMLATINVAAERQGYTMTDRGTYIKYEDTHKGNNPLVILVEKDPSLLNQYSVLEVNPARCPQVKNDLAKRFSDWLAGPTGQQAIGAFTLMNKRLFTPNATPQAESSAQEE